MRKFHIVIHKNFISVPLVKTFTSLPMTLEPLQMLLGTWYMDAQNINTRYPMDFLDSAQGYTEKIEFLRPFASPFDGSSISFR